MTSFTRAIVIVLDNGLYAIEQWLVAGQYFDDPAARPTPYLALHRWSYADLAKSMGFSFTRTVDTVDTFRQALNDAKTNNGPSFIAASVKPHNLPSGLSST